MRRWYAEEEAFFERSQSSSSREQWVIYECFNKYYALDRFVIPSLTADTRLLSFGGGDGREVSELYKNYGFQLYGIDASTTLLKGFATRFPSASSAKATTTGDIPYPGELFDVILCFGVLHHIPNVSKSLAEFSRVLKPRGILVIREPVCDMGPPEVRNRTQLSPNERGMPVDFITSELEHNGLQVLHVRLAYFRPWMRLIGRLRSFQKWPMTLYYLDSVLCALFFRSVYERRSLLDRFAAGSAYYVATKR